MVKKFLTYIIILFQGLFIGTGGILIPESTFAASPFTFTVTTDNNWGSGFCYQFTTQNTSASPVSNWVIGFDLAGGTLTSTFGGNYTNSGGSYEITTPGAYADPMAVGQSVNMGFCGNGAGGVSNLTLKSYAGMSGGGGSGSGSSGGGGSAPAPGSVLQDYNITFGGLQVDVTTASSWATGYCRDVRVENISGNTITSWQLDFELDQALASGYSATYSQVSTSHTITPLSWNQTLNPGQSTIVGFCSNGTNYDYDWVSTVGGVSSPLSGGAGLQIGTGSVVGTTSFDSMITWDGNFPGFGSGAVSSVNIKARVLPTLNMSISTGAIDLGDLTAGVASSGSLFLEIGTNAKSGVSITARSQSGGLTKTDDAAVQINSLTTDGVAESYTWASTPNATDDASSPAFAATGLTALEVNDIVTEHTVYSTNKAEASNLVDDVEFVVSATAGAETPAGDYEDYVTFTVTGNF